MYMTRGNARGIFREITHAQSYLPQLMPLGYLNRHDGFFGLTEAAY
jgi:hypothetical protein